MTSIPIPKCPFPNPYNHRIIWTPLTGFIDLDIVGHIVLNHDKTHYKIMMFEWFGSTGYYRGQNKDFPSFTTSWQRLKTPLEKCLNWIQKEEFIDWFISTPFFEHFISRFEFAYRDDIPEGQGAKFAFDFEAIAQHYEFATNYLDMTTKKEIAEFFAYTYKDEKSGKYKPVEDFNKFKPCLFSSIAGKSLSNPYNKDVRIVGFQPLIRPIRQFAMAIDLQNAALDYNKEFHKNILPQDKKKAFEIFDKFKGGEEIFPEDDYASYAAKMIREKVINERIINNEIFVKYCENFKQDSEELAKSLSEQGYIFTDYKLLMTDELIQEMQNYIDENLIPWIKEFVTYSPRY